MVEAFRSSREHLYAELARLDLMIQREVWRWRQANPPSPHDGDEFRGLYVSDAEVDAILDGVYPGSEQVLRHAEAEEVERAFCAALDRVRDEIVQCKSAAAKRGFPLRLAELEAMFGLSPFDVDVLLVALAPEIDLRYERLYAYLQDDVTRKRPTVSMVMNLLCDTPEGRLDARARFHADAPLLSHGLIALLEDPSVPQPPLLARYVRAAPRIVEFLLAEDGRAMDDRLRGFCQVLAPDPDARAWQALHVPGQVRAELDRLAARHPRELQGSATLILLQGDAGTSRYEAARALCSRWRRSLLVADLPRMFAEHPAPAREDTDFGLLKLVAREAYLSGAALYWQGYDVWSAAHESPDAEQALHRDALHAAMLTYPVTNLLPVEREDRQPDRTLLSAPCLVRIDFPRPSYPLRRAHWEQALDTDRLAPGLEVADVAGRFRLTEEQIEEAALDAGHRAGQRPPGEERITHEDLFASARARTSDQLRGQAKKIEPRHEWSDLVLPSDQIAQLHELCDQMKYRHIVLGEWGFDRKLSMGKGLNALFAGPSGTGKTMAAEVIARDLGLDLYKIDLSTVMSKYVGETEKNLERIFAAAHNSNAILFFDEADALFGKRSEVRDAHDRYANVEISYLLQRMEEYDGLVILTSNLSQNMDEAFVRRMHFTVEFPYPEQEDRRRIWQIAFPKEAPLRAEIDLDLLAERYRLTGGNIRNIALTAAFLAARDGGVIDMGHLLWATRREYQKMGRLADEREFVME